MKCSLCGLVFDEKDSKPTCRSCQLVKGCKLIRCPRCGFETPPEPRWLRIFKPKGKSG